MLAVLLAHQGGWDEFLFVGGPIVLIGGLLALANRRAKAALAAQEGTTDEVTPAATTEDPTTR